MERTPERTISVIIPTYDRQKELQQCLEGLRQQTHGKYEVIVLNDGGPALNRDAPQFRELDDLVSRENVTVLNSPKRNGSAKVRNHGYSISKGDLIAFTDDDAIPESNWLESINRYFEVHPTVTAMNGRIEAVALDTAGERIRQAYYDYRQQIHLSGVLDPYYRIKYNLVTDVPNLTDWLSLGNCVLQKEKVGERKMLFDDSMKLNYGRKLGREFMRNGQLVTYAPDPVIRHHHARTIREMLGTRAKNGRNFCQIDDEERRTYGERFTEMMRYFKYVFGNGRLKRADKLLEAVYSTAFISSYVCQKVKNTVLSSAYVKA